MAGIKLAAGQRVVAFTALDPAVDSVVVTIAGSSASLPGTEPGSVKVTPYAEYPAKGRATGGVRCHRFLKGEDELILAWAGPAPARAAERQRCPRRPAGGQRPAGRLRDPGHDARRGHRRAGRRRRSARPDGTGPREWPPGQRLLPVDRRGRGAGLRLGGTGELLGRAGAARSVGT